MGETPERAREQAGLLPHGDTGQINHSQGGLGRSVAVSTSHTAHVQLRAQGSDSTPGLGHLGGVLSPGLSFLICKVKEAARRCLLRVLSVPKVKVWVSCALGALWCLWPWPIPYRAAFGQH